jgi:hypothetical protein
MTDREQAIALAEMQSSRDDTSINNKILARALLAEVAENERLREDCRVASYVSEAREKEITAAREKHALDEMQWKSCHTGLIARIAEIEGNLGVAYNTVDDSSADTIDALKSQVAQLEATVVGMRAALIGIAAMAEETENNWVTVQKLAASALSAPPTAYQARVERLVDAIRLLDDKGRSHTMLCGDHNRAGREPWEPNRSPYICVCHRKIIDSAIAEWDQK